MTLALALVFDSLKIVKPVPSGAKDFLPLNGSRPNNLARSLLQPRRHGADEIKPPHIATLLIGFILFRRSDMRKNESLRQNWFLEEGL